MQLELSGAQQTIVESTRRLAATTLAPTTAARARAHEIPREVMLAIARAGLIGVNLDKKWGGAQAGVVAYAAAVRELAYADPAVAVTMAVTNMVAEVIAAFGSEEQKISYLPKLARGDFFAGAFALSEPGAGSDAASLTTRAVPDRDGFVLSGEKLWISHGDQSDVVIVWARTGGPGAKGITCFIVEKGAQGLSAGKPEEKMGIVASHTVPLSLDQVRVPKAARLGAEGDGFKLAMVALDGGRIGVAAQALGIGCRALDLAKARLQALERAGAGAGAGQAAQFALADMAVELDAAWLLVLRAAWLKERKRPFSREAAMAKVFASEAANRAVRAAIDLCGTGALVGDSEASRLLRDCRVTQIYEGTSEVQRLVIARDVLRQGVLS
ncbi:MAG: acyl-CoA dehydrogenase family protein [Deltaproteobacteria bacterium]|nr:acyl-CoA dehydrogenase family protein [Deltaproteobacteria bacterium]